MNKYIVVVVVVTLILGINLIDHTSNQVEKRVPEMIAEIIVVRDTEIPYLRSPHIDSNCDGINEPIMMCDEIELKFQLTTEIDSSACGQIYAKLGGIYHTRGDEAKAVDFYRIAIKLDTVNAGLYKEYLEESLKRCSDCESV